MTRKKFTTTIEEDSIKKVKKLAIDLGSSVNDLLEKAIEYLLKKYTKKRSSKKKDVEQVRKKLREARFFLSKIAECNDMVFGEREHFDFYLSAFLNAGRSVDWRLIHEQGTLYETFRVSWDNARSTDEKRLIKFMIGDRNVEVHESGSNRAEIEGRIPVYDSYEDKSGKASVFAAPGTPLAKITKITYLFTINGQQVSVLEACRIYIDLLDLLVAEYCQAQGIT